MLPEYKDERVLKATEIILKEGFVTPVLVGNPAEIAEAAKAVDVSIEGAEIIDPANYDRYQEMVDTSAELRAKKRHDSEKLDATMKGDCFILRRYARLSCAVEAWLLVPVAQPQT